MGISDYARKVDLSNKYQTLINKASDAAGELQYVKNEFIALKNDEALTAEDKAEIDAAIATIKYNIKTILGIA